MRNCLIVMIRYPKPGSVKTRLARALGTRGACALYLAFLKDIAGRFRKGPAKVFWAYTPARADLGRLPWLGGETIAQRGRSLGARMHNAMRAAFERGYERVVLVGSDAPHIQRRWVEDAFAALAAKDVVFGPSHDGGYYLVGLRAPHDIFSGLRWSTPTVLARSLGRAKRLGLEVALVTPTFDVDEPEDLPKLLCAVARDRRGLAHTREALRAQGLSPERGDAVRAPSTRSAR